MSKMQEYLAQKRAKQQAQSKPTSDAEPGALSQVDAALRGTAQGASLGLIDEATAGVGAAIDTTQAFFGQRGDIDWDDAYKTRLDSVRGADHEAKKEHPFTYGAGELGGGVLASTIPGLNVGKGAKATEMIAKTGAEGLISGYGMSEAKDPDALAKDVLAGAATGVGFGAVGKGLEKAVDVMAPGAAKLLTMSPESVDKYVANPTRYADEVTVEGLAKKYRPSLEKMEGRAADLSKAAESASKVADDAKRYKVQSLRDTAPPKSAEDALKTALKDQRAKVQGLANQQRELVGSSSAEVSIEPLLDQLNQRLKSREIGGVLPAVDPEIQDIQKMKSLLESVRDRKLKPGAEYTDDLLEGLQAEGMSVDPQSMVNLRQTVDRLIQPTWTGPGAKHIPAGEAAGRELRGSINNILDGTGSQLPGYSQLRKELAGETKLATEASEALGDPDAAKILSGISNPKNDLDFQTLKRLDARNGKKVLPELNEYLSAQGKLRDKTRLDKNLEALPEVGKASEAEKKAFLYDRLNKRMNGLSSENVDKKVKEALFANKNNPKLQTKEGLEEFARRSGNDVADDLDKLKVSSDFGRAGAQGSRLVNMLSSFGVDPLSKGALATVGAGLDVHRGKTAKTILDGYLKAKDGVDVGTKMAAQSLIPVAVDAFTPEEQAYLAQVEKKEGPQKRAMMEYLLKKRAEKK